MIDEKIVYEKIVKMFRPYSSDMFLGYPGKVVIVGPNDRALFGFDNCFPIEWLVEDYGFTREEALWFVHKVHKLHAK